MRNKLILFSLPILILSGCKSDESIISDADTNIKHLNYSLDPNILYQDPVAEIIKSDKTEYVTLNNGMQLQKLNDSCYILDSDMLLTEEQVKNLDINTSGSTSTKSSVSIKANAWFAKIVYYTFHPNVTNSFKNEILAAMNSWSQQTKLVFVARRPPTNLTESILFRDYIEFVLGNDGSYSYVGRIGGKQQLHLDESWADRGTVMHEIGHAIGLIHTHQSATFHSNQNITPYKINFKWDNILDDKKKHYTLESAQHHDYIHAADTNYPMNSLMIYSSFSLFAKNPNFPVLTVSRSFDNSEEFTFSAQRSYLSINDRLAVANKYEYEYDPYNDPNRPPL